MKIAITGLSNSGKTTIFNALTGQDLVTTIYPTAAGEPHYGTVRVPDPRIDMLSDLFRPKKTTWATVEYVDYLGLTKGDVEQNRKVFDLIKDADAIVHVVRAFRDDAVSHPLGGPDPFRDFQTVELEMIFGDLEFIEKRLTRMEESAKKGKKPNESERNLLLKLRDILEKEIPLRDVDFDEEERKAMSPLQFISIKPEVVVVNVGEQDLQSADSTAVTAKIEAFLTEREGGRETRVVTLSGKIEMEIAQLPPEEAEAFLEDLKITEPALHRLIRVCYELLGMISFLTVGDDEVRAWTIRRGTSALFAAGKVHSDIQRGFIRAEVVHYDDFIGAGSLAAAREKGLLRLEGKTYEVRDGDIINFRFNV